MPTNFYGVELNEHTGSSDGGFDSIRSIQVVHLVYHIAGTEKVRFYLVNGGPFMYFYFHSPWK